MMNRALVVDDEPQLLALVALLLEERGLSVAQARSGEEALRLLAAEHFDLALLDVELPGASGLDVLERAAEHLETTIVLVMSGDPGYASRALAAGATAFLAKPLLREGLERALDGAGARKT